MRRKDIAQKTFLQLYIYYDKADKKKIASWLYTVAKHYAINYKKKADREVYENEDDTVSILERPRESTEEEFMEHVLYDDTVNLCEKIFARC